MVKVRQVFKGWSHLSGIGAPQVFSPSPTLPHSPRRRPCRNRAGPVTLRRKRSNSGFVAQIHLAAPPGPGSAGLGLGGGTGGREGSAGSGALGSPSGSIVSWSTAQETEERNSLRGKQIV